MTNLIFTIGLPLFLLMLGLLVGRSREQRHFRDLERRERAMRDMRLTQIRSYPGFRPGKAPPRMMVGEVVIASDYFKSFLAGLRNLFGGELTSYESLLERARREATLRILEQAREAGYDAVCNLRLETADLGGNASSAGKRGRAAMATILASATAYQAQPPV